MGRPHPRDDHTLGTATPLGRRHPREGEAPAEPRYPAARQAVQLSSSFALPDDATPATSRRRHPREGEAPAEPRHPTARQAVRLSSSFALPDDATPATLGRRHPREGEAPAEPRAIQRTHQISIEGACLGRPGQKKGRQSHPEDAPAAPDSQKTHVSDGRSDKLSGNTTGDAIIP